MDEKMNDIVGCDCCLLKVASVSGSCVILGRVVLLLASKHA